MQIDPNNRLLEFIFTSRLIDVGAIVVSVTAVIVSTKNAISALKKEITKLCEIVENLTNQRLHQEIEIEKIKARCIHNRKHREECTEES